MLAGGVRVPELIESVRRRMHGKELVSCADMLTRVPLFEQR